MLEITPIFMSMWPNFDYETPSEHQLLPVVQTGNQSQERFFRTEQALATYQVTLELPWAKQYALQRT